MQRQSGGFARPKFPPLMLLCVLLLSLGSLMAAGGDQLTEACANAAGVWTEALQSCTYMPMEVFAASVPKAANVNESVCSAGPLGSRDRFVLPNAANKEAFEQLLGCPKTDEESMAAYQLSGDFTLHLSRGIMPIQGVTLTLPLEEPGTGILLDFVRGGGEVPGGGLGSPDGWGEGLSRGPANLTGLSHLSVLLYVWTLDNFYESLSGTLGLQLGTNVRGELEPSGGLVRSLADILLSDSTPPRSADQVDQGDATVGQGFMETERVAIAVHSDGQPLMFRGYPVVMQVVTPSTDQRWVTRFRLFHQKTPALLGYASLGTASSVESCAILLEEADEEGWASATWEADSGQCKVSAYTPTAASLKDHANVYTFLRED